MRKFAELDPDPHATCRAGWHSYVIGHDPDDVVYRCKRCLKLKVYRILQFQGWLRRHGLPRIHGCVWDRECRGFHAPLRIALMWRGHMWLVDLPGYYKDFVFGSPFDRPGDAEVRRFWHRPWAQHSYQAEVEIWDEVR